MSRSTVRNAADRKQVRRAGQREREARDHALEDLKACLAVPAFRRTMSRWLDRLRPLDMMWDPSGAVVHYKAGHHDVAVMLLNELEEADPERLHLMYTESAARKRDERIEDEAAAKPGNNDKEVESW